MHAYTISMTLNTKSLDTKNVEGACLGGSARKLNQMVSAIYDGALANAGLKTSQFGVLEQSPIENKLGQENRQSISSWMNRRSAATWSACARGAGCGSCKTRIAVAI
jgi:hypothetical protein